MYASHVPATVLAKMLSSSKGTAEIIFGSPVALYARGLVLRSPQFASFKSGESIIVRFKVSRKMRHIVRVSPLCPEGEPSILSRTESLSKFVKSVGLDLVREHDLFDKRWKVESEASLISEESRFFETVQRMMENSGGVASVSEEPVVAEPKFRAISSEWMGNIFIEAKAMAIFNTARVIADSGSPVNVLMVGPSGYGKTSIPEAYAKANGMKFVRINCAQVRDPEEWYGYREARGGDTVFVPSEFTRAVTEGHAVIVMDEFNRVEPWLHNTLYPLLDHARKTSVHGEEIVCGNSLIFVATVNVGYQFTGTFMLDAAITNRMDLTLLVGALPEKIEASVLCKRCGISDELSASIVKFISSIRTLNNTGEVTVDASTRTSLKMATFLKPGLMTAKDVIASVILNNVEPEERKIIVDRTTMLVEEIQRHVEA